MQRVLGVGLTRYRCHAHSRITLRYALGASTKPDVAVCSSPTCIVGVLPDDGLHKTVAFVCLTSLEHQLCLPQSISCAKSLFWLGVNSSHVLIQHCFLDKRNSSFSKYTFVGIVQEKPTEYSIPTYFLYLTPYCLCHYLSRLFPADIILH